MDEVSILRRFNRAYTPRVGVLTDSYLDSGRPLGPSRLLFEIGLHGASILDLRRRLGLDSGYVSRMLSELQVDGLITSSPDPQDRRQRVVSLTAKGRRAWQRLDARSHQLAERLLDPLTDRQRADLASALAAAERLLRAATVSFDLIDPADPEARDAMNAYFGELNDRFDGGFDPGPGGAASDAVKLRPPSGAFVVLRDDGDVVGCGGVQQIDASTAEIKRMWIHREHRGLGLGVRLLTHLESVASGLGHERVVLDTNGSLTEAIAMYRRAGYTPIAPYNDNPYAQHWFAKPLPSAHP